MSITVEGQRAPEPYMIPVGEEDNKRLDALGAIFNPYSLSWLAENTENCSDEKITKFLDAGCGNGSFTNLIASTYPQLDCVGVDISQEQVDVARKSAEEKKLTNISWRIDDVYHLEDLKEKNPDLFDIVHCRFVLSHLTDPPKAVDQLLSMVRPGGILLIEEIGSRFKFEYNQAPVKAMEAWQKMVDMQRQMQKSHKDTSERVYNHLLTTETVAPARTRSYDIYIDTQLKKSMFRMGVEHGLKKIKEIGKPELIKAFGYEDGETWLKEMREFEIDDSASAIAKNLRFIAAIKCEVPSFHCSNNGGSPVLKLS